jgi:hypothetical protein
VYDPYDSIDPLLLLEFSNENNSKLPNVAAKRDINEYGNERNDCCSGTRPRMLIIDNN